MDYFINFYEGQPPRQGKIIVGDACFSARKPGKAISTPGYLWGLMGRRLSERFDAAIVQAAANVWQKPIYYSTHVDIMDSERQRALAAQGYQPISGYLEDWYKIYTPQLTPT